MITSAINKSWKEKQNMGNLMCITSAIDKSWKEKQKTWIKNGVNVLKPPSLFNEFRSWEDENTEAGRQAEISRVYYRKG